jgi:hypothetical protein
MWSLVATAALAAEAQPPLLREPPPYGLPPKVEWVVRHADGSPLDTASFLDATDAPVDVREAHRVAQNKRMTAGVVLGTTGLAIGIAGAVVATVIAVDTYDEETGTAEFYGIALASGLVGTLVAATAAGPLTSHSRHRKYPSLVLTEEQADALITRHNEAAASP